MPEESDYESLPSSEEMLRSFSSEDLIKQAREELRENSPGTSIPELETEVEVQVDFEELAAREPEPRIETTFTPATRRRPPPQPVDPTVAAPHERHNVGRGLAIGIAAWVVILGIAIFLIAALAVEAP
jgi:hypothetical protein